MSNHHQITFEQAKTYIHNYLSNPDLFALARTKSFGGMFLPDDIKGTPIIFKGFIFWFCWNTGHYSNLPPYFLAAEDYNEYDTNNPGSTQIRKPKLKRPADNGLFNFPYQLPPSPEETAYFLENHTLTIDSAEDVLKIPVQILSENFSKNFPGTPPLGFKKSPYCFFAKEKLGGEIDTGVEDFFKDPDLVYVRYYFGLVPDPKFGPDILKVILFGVDKFGRNLVNGVMLEQSWPPDPFN